MDSNLMYCSVATPTPKPQWIAASDVERISMVRAAVNTQPNIAEAVEIVQAAADGQIIVKLLETLPPDRRGTLLLDLEAFLKETIDAGLVVWHEALGDKNSLRNLRGIEVKA